jgi:hypothetical protein
LNLLQITSENEGFSANQLAQRMAREFGVDALASNTIHLFEKLAASHNKIKLKNA